MKKIILTSIATLLTIGAATAAPLPDGGVVGSTTFNTKIGDTAQLQPKYTSTTIVGALNEIDMNKFVAGTNIQISEPDPTTGEKTITAIVNGEVAAGDNNIVTGDTVYQYIDGLDLGDTVDAGTNIIISAGPNGEKVINATANGNIEDGDTGLVSGDTVYQYIENLEVGDVVNQGEGISITEEADGSKTISLDAELGDKVEAGENITITTNPTTGAKIINSTAMPEPPAECFQGGVNNCIAAQSEPGVWKWLPMY